MTLWTILHSDGSPLPLYAPLLPYLHCVLLQHFFVNFSDKLLHTLLIPSLIDAPPLHHFFRVSELVLACFLLHLFFGSTYHIAFLLLLWLLFLRSHLRYRRPGTLCTPSICKLQPFIFSHRDLLLLDHIFPLSHHLVPHLLFSIVFRLGAVPLLFQARRGSFQQVLLSDPELRRTERTSPLRF